MSEQSENRVIFLDDYLDLSTVDVIEWSPNLELAPRASSTNDILKSLKGRLPL